MTTANVPKAESVPVVDDGNTADEAFDERKAPGDGENRTPLRLDKHGLPLSPQPTTLKSDPLVCHTSENTPLT